MRMTESDNQSFLGKVDSIYGNSFPFETFSLGPSLCERKEDIVKKQEDAEMQRSFGTARQRRLAWCLWAIFTTGLLVEMAAPRLKIEDNAFVMPPISDAQGAILRPDVLVRRERWMRGISGILTLGGALALGVYYRRNLVVAFKG